MAPGWAGWWRSRRVSSEDFDCLKRHAGLGSTVGSGGSAELGSFLASVRAANPPLALVTGYSEHLAAVTSEGVPRVAAVCRATTSLGLLGDPAVIDHALAATGQVPDRTTTP